MSTLAAWIYIGGVQPFYSRERKHHGRLYSAVSALFWPLELGAALARAAWHLENPKG